MRKSSSTGHKSRRDAKAIIEAAEIGGNDMAAMEPFGAAIGAVVGALEEGAALLKDKKKNGKGPRHGS